MVYYNYSLYQSTHKLYRQMIKKSSHYQPYPSKHPPAYLKSDHGNQNNVPKKALSTTTSNHPLYTSKPLKLLRQITNELPLSYKPLKRDNQKCIKSQTSIADLSEIVAIELSSNQKKQSHIRQVQPNERPLIHDLESIDAFYLRKQQIQPHQPQAEDNSLRLDDFQILDVYQATAIKKTQQVDSVSDLRNRRRSGGIRRNSRVASSNKPESLTKTNYSSGTQQFNQIQFIEKQLSSKLSSRKSSQPHTRRTSVDLSHLLDDDIRKCGQKLFNSICSNKKHLIVTELEKAKLTCEMRLILGPIVTKFRQNKYSELNLQRFSKEFAGIMKDFSPKESLQIVKKIQLHKFLEVSEQSNIREAESVYLNKPEPLMNMSKCQSKYQPNVFDLPQLPKKHPHHKSHPSPTTQSSPQTTTQKRLQKLTSKVDSFLNKISSQYNNSKPNQIMQKNKVSNLMSRLTQIEQLSGDSEDLVSKRQTLPNEVSQIEEITKDVYVEVSERRITEGEECESRYGLQEINERQLEQRQRYQQDAFLLNQPQFTDRDFNPFKKQVIYPPLQCLSSAESTKRKLFNYSESINRQRHYSNKRIHQKLFPQQQSSLESTSRISFKTVNLQFSELSKYLQ